VVADVKDDRRVWPDSDAISRGGHLYISTSHIHEAAPFRLRLSTVAWTSGSSPYGLFRVKLAE
jgi:hypothetical protein